MCEIFPAKSWNLYSFSKLQFPNPCNVIDDDVMPKSCRSFSQFYALDSAVFYALQRLGTPSQTPKGGQLDSDGAVGEKESPRPLVARSASRPTFASLMGYKRSLVDTCKSSSFHVFVVLLAIFFVSTK